MLPWWFFFLPHLPHLTIHFNDLFFCYFLSLVSFTNFMVWFNLSSGLFATLLGILYKLNGNRIALLYIYNLNFNFMKQLSRKNLYGKIQLTLKLIWLIVLFLVMNVCANPWNICAMYTKQMRALSNFASLSVFQCLFDHPSTQKDCN